VKACGHCSHSCDREEWLPAPHSDLGWRPSAEDREHHLGLSANPHLLPVENQGLLC
jgi:hypothetical protein